MDYQGGEPLLLVGAGEARVEPGEITDRPVRSVGTLDTVQRHIQEDAIAGVITEHSLPDGTGIDVLETVRAVDSDLPVVIWTDSGCEETASTAISNGVTEYIIRDGDTRSELAEAVSSIENAHAKDDQSTDQCLDCARFRRLVETTPIGIAVVGPRGRIIRANDQVRSLLADSQTTVSGRDLDDFALTVTNWDEEPIPAVDRPVARVQRDASDVQMEVRVERPDGESRFLSVHAAPFDSSQRDGGTDEVLLVLEDVTEFIDRGDTLAEEKQLSQAVFEEAFDAILIADDDGEYVDANPAACELFGLSREELLGRSIEEFAADDYDFEAEWRQFQASNNDRGLFPLVRADGERRIVEFAATPNVQSDRHLSVLRDVTERQDAQDQLKRERDRAELYFNTASVMMLVLDRDGVVTRANEQVCDVLGRPEDEVVGTNWVETFVPKSERPAVRDGFERALNGDGSDLDEYENSVITAEGDRRQIRWRNTVIRDEDGTVTGILGSGTDVTDQRQFAEMRDGLYRSTRTLLEAESRAEVNEIVVDTVTELLDVAGTVLYEYDSQDDLLRPASQSIEASFMRSTFPAVPPDESSITGRVYTRGESRLFRDVSKSPYLQTSETEMRAGIFTPIGDHGILVVGSRHVGTFDEQMQQLLELFVSNAEAVYDRVARNVELTRSERRLTLALTVSDAGIWDWQEKTDQLVVCEGMESLLGVDDDSFDGTYQSLLDYVDPEDRSRLDDTLQSAIRNYEDFDVEFRVGPQIDDLRWIHAQGTVVSDTDGGSRLLGVGIDITEQKQQQEDLELFRDLVDHASDGIYVIDPETADIVEANETACTMLGYDHETLLTKNATDINPEFTPEMRDSLVEEIREQDGTVMETTHERRDGSTFPVEVRISVANLDQEYHISTVQDITEERARTRELKASEERYQSLIELAPDPIFVVDADTGDIVEANAAACSLRGEPRADLLGRHYTDLHPPGEESRYRSLFEQHVERDGASRRHNGEQIHLATAEGERVPVSIHSSTISIQGRTLVQTVFRNITAQKRYEETLAALNQDLQAFLSAETDHEIAESAIEIAETTLGLDAVALYRYDDEQGCLIPMAYSDAVLELVGDVPTLTPGESIAWRSFAEGEQTMLADVRADDDVYDPETSIRSELVVPLGDHGVFIAGDTTTDAFDDPTVEFVEILTLTVEAALDRVSWTQNLQERKRELQQRSTRLERVNQINEKIRSIIQAVVNASSRTEIEQAVCDHLAELDRFEFAWVGKPDYSTDTLTAEAWAGTSPRYVEDIPKALNEEAAEPSIRAVQNNETVAIPNTATNIQDASWQQTALRYELRSAISIPLWHQDSLYGVLSIYGKQPDVFDAESSAVLRELGELVGYGIHAAEQRRALLDPGTVELGFEIATDDEPLVGFASRIDSALDIKNVSSRPDGSYLVQVAAPDTTPDAFHEATTEFHVIQTARTLSTESPPTFELVLTGDCVVTVLASLAATIHEITISPDSARVSVLIPEDRNVPEFIEQLRSSYPDTSLVSRQSTGQDRQLHPTTLQERLSERQREVLKTAYYAGYFDQPRESTGSEIAEALGISQPAFSTQLRQCQQKLLEPIYS